MTVPLELALAEIVLVYAAFVESMNVVTVVVPSGAKTSTNPLWVAEAYDTVVVLETPPNVVVLVLVPAELTP
jgi:hypothetical protein